MENKFIMVEKSCTWLCMVEANERTLTHKCQASKSSPKKNMITYPSSANEFADPIVHLKGYFELNFNVMITKPIKDCFINETDVEKIKSKKKNPKRVYFRLSVSAHNWDGL